MRRAWLEQGGWESDFERQARLRQEITPILLACLEKELAAEIYRILSRLSREVGAWRHVAVTWSGDTWQLFLDGILVSHADRIPPDVEPHVNAAFWKALPGGMNGDITIGSEDLALDEVRISSRARYGWPPAAVTNALAPAVPTAPAQPPAAVTNAV